jgi:hypothetical protein
VKRIDQAESEIRIEIRKTLQIVSRYYEQDRTAAQKVQMQISGLHEFLPLPLRIAPNARNGPSFL